MDNAQWCDTLRILCGIAAKGIQKEGMNNSKNSTACGPFHKLQLICKKILTASSCNDIICKSIAILTVDRPEGGN